MTTQATLLTAEQEVMASRRDLGELPISIQYLVWATLDAERERAKLAEATLAARSPGIAEINTLYDERDRAEANLRKATARILALEEALKGLRLNGNYCAGSDVDRHDAKIEAALEGRNDHGN